MKPAGSARKASRRRFVPDDRRLRHDVGIGEALDRAGLAADDAGERRPEPVVALLHDVAGAAALLVEGEAGPCSCAARARGTAGSGAAGSAGADLRLAGSARRSAEARAGPVRPSGRRPEGADCGSAGPPAETPTWAGRSSRSPIMKPSPITWMMSPALVPGTGASNIAWCSFGSKRSPGFGAILTILCFSKALSSVAPGQLDALDQPGRGGADGVGHRVERAVEVVVDRQQVAGEAGRAVELGVAAVALGALADVLDVGERPQQPVLEVGDLGAERRGLVGSRAASSVISSSSPTSPRDRRGTGRSLPSGRACSCASPSRRPFALIPGWRPACRPAARCSRRSGRCGRSSAASAR